LPSGVLSSEGHFKKTLVAKQNEPLRAGIWDAK